MEQIEVHIFHLQFFYQILHSIHEKVNLNEPIYKLTLNFGPFNLCSLVYG